MAKIEINHCDDCGGWHLSIGEVQVLRTSVEGIARRHARILSECRTRPHREALRMLTQEIGYDSLQASALYNVLMGVREARTMQ